jgi:hypothetical protein
MEYVEELESVPEPAHVEEVMNGFIDTVSGNEGFTKAQHYLEGVLFSNGIIRHHEVGGTEGILSKVGDGAKAALEYIKKMFRAIWDFFFKSEKKELEKKVDEALKKVEKDLEAMEKANVTPENADAALKKADAAINKLKDGPEKTKLKEKVNAAQDSDDPKHKAQVADTMPGEVFQAWRLNDLILTAFDGKFKASIKTLEELRDKEKASGNKYELSDEIQIVLNGLIGLPEVAGKITDLQSADAYIKKAYRCKEAMINNLTTIENQETRYKEMISEIESGKGKEELGKSTTALKESLVGITTIVNQCKDVIKWMMDIARMIGNACVVII